MKETGKCATLKCRSLTDEVILKQYLFRLGLMSKPKKRLDIAINKLAQILSLAKQFVRQRV